MEMECRDKSKVDATDNPFCTSDYVLRDDFFAREKQINRIMEFIAKKNDRYLFLYGQRRMGKTSLLKKILELVNRKQIHKAAFFNLQGKAIFDISRLLFELALRIFADIEANIDINKNDFPGNGAEEFFKDRFLPGIFEEIGKNRQLIVLFDEFDALEDKKGVNASPGKSNLAYYKFIPLLIEIKSKNFPIKFIFAVGKDYKDLEKNRFGQLIKLARQVEISYFNKKELENLVKKLSANLLPFEPKAIDGIYELTSGHPFFSQCLASLAFDEAVNSGQKSVTAEIIHKQLDPAIKRYGSGVVWLWRSFTQNEKIILYLMAVLKNKNQWINEKILAKEASYLNFLPASDDMKTILEKLTRLKIIKKTQKQGPHYDFYVEFFRKWIVMEITVDMLLKTKEDDSHLHLSPATYT